MKPLKIALLEDNKHLLKELNRFLADSDEVKVVAYSTDTEDFRQKVKEKKPQALILDIEMNDSDESGIDIANSLQLPVLFVSGKTKDYVLEIEELNMSSEESVILHVSKPITKSKIDKILPKFTRQVRQNHEAQSILLRFLGGEHEEIDPRDIVYLDSDKRHNSGSNNKRIYFRNRQPQTLVDFSFTKMIEKGFDTQKFVTISKSTRVNVDRIEERSKSELRVEAMNEDGKMTEVVLSISENYRNSMK